LTKSTVGPLLVFINLGTCIAPAQPWRAALGAESRAVYHNEHSCTATSVKQQQVRTKCWLTATAGARSCNLRYANTPLWPHGQIPPQLVYPYITNFISDILINVSTCHHVKRDWILTVVAGSLGLAPPPLLLLMEE
jgi:hypothetical protein